MKWAAAIVAAVLAVPMALVVLFAGSDEDCGSGKSGGNGKDPADDSVHVSNVKPIEGYSKKQMTYAAIIAKVGEKQKLGKPAQTMAIMAAIQESTLGTGSGWDKPNADHDAGLFQQRVKPGWYGSLKMVLKTSYAAKAFMKGVTAKHDGDWGSTGGGGHLPGLVDYKKKWGSSAQSYNNTIQKVQGSATPDAYTKWFKDAERILKGLSGTSVSGLAGDANQKQRPVAAEAATKKRTYKLPHVHKAPKKVAQYLGNKYGIKTIGGYRKSAHDPKGHPSGNALDFMINDVKNGRSVGQSLASDAQNHAKKYGVDYIIWKQRIWTAGNAKDSWKKMEDRGSKTANHFDHVHINIKPGAKVPDNLGGGNGSKSSKPKAGGDTSCAGDNGGGKNGNNSSPDGDAKKGGVMLDKSFWEYYQGDDPWRTVDYGHGLGISGCGPTATASVLTTFYPKNPTTPKTAAAYFKSNGGYVPGEGSAHLWPEDGIQKHFKFKTQTVQPSAANARRGINKNGLVLIAVSAATPFTSGGHIMTIRGLDGQKFLVGTSSGRGKKNSQSQNYKSFDERDMNFGAGTNNMWIITPTAKSNFKKLVK